MTQEDVAADDELHELLDQICERYSMATREDAIGFLIKRRLRRGAAQISGQGRKLELIRNRGQL